MNKKRRISVSLKITLLVIIVIPIVVFGNFLINIGIDENDAGNPVYESQYDKADVLIYGLNLSVSNNLNNSTYINNVIRDFINWNNEVIRININLLNESKELIIKGSSNNTKIGKNANTYILNAITSILIFYIVLYCCNVDIMKDEIADRHHILFI